MCFSQLLGLLTRTTEAGESNSILLIGPRGSGKTTVCIIVQYSVKNVLLTTMHIYFKIKDSFNINMATIIKHII